MSFLLKMDRFVDVQKVEEDRTYLGGVVSVFVLPALCVAYGANYILAPFEERVVVSTAEAFEDKMIQLQMTCIAQHGSKFVGTSGCGSQQAFDDALADDFCAAADGSAAGSSPPVVRTCSSASCGEGMPNICAYVDPDPINAPTIGWNGTNLFPLWDSNP